MQRVGGEYTVIDGNGNGVSGAVVTVYDSVTLLPLANVYNAGGSLTAPASKANPFTTDAVGRWEIALPDGRYNFEISGGNIATYTIYNHAIFDSTITYPSPALGTVTSVAQTVPAEMTIAGSPITGTGTLALDWATEVKNKIFAGPTTGADAKPTFRVAVLADLPSFGPTASTTFGSATKASVVTTNAQGIITAISESTVTPAFASITSLPATVAGHGITNGISVLLTGPSANITIGNTTTETSMVSSPYTSINGLPGNGTTIKAIIYGYITHTQNNTVRIRMKYGAQVLLDTTALSLVLGAAAASSPFKLEVIFTGRVAGGGGTGTGMGQIMLFAPSTTLATVTNGTIWPQPGFTAETTGLTNTAAAAIDILWQWGTATATETLTITNFTVTQETS